MAFLSTQPYKGTRDFYPDEMRLRRWIFGQMREVIESYGYQEYDGPLLEPFEVYAAKTGEEIVNQQLYWLMDRGERKMAIRPEMTPTMARMVAQKFHELAKPIRWYSIPNLWRYERPQKGRLREHWQLNVDVLGGDALMADCELLRLSLDLMKKFKGEKLVSIRVNNRRLMDQLFSEKLKLTPEVTALVIKAIDAKDKIGDEAFTKLLTDHGLNETQKVDLNRFFKSSFDEVAIQIPGTGVDELKTLFEMMKNSGAQTPIVFDPTIMRGMNYYTGTVFEMYDTSAENRRAMFGGGRYDNLVGLFGKDKISGVGLGMGDVTLRDFLETHQLIPELGYPLDVYVSLPSLEIQPTAEKIAASLRDRSLKVMTPLEVGGFGAQLKQAVKHGARFAVLFGDDEFKQGNVLLKDLKLNQQTTVPIADVYAAISKSNV